ncbi:MAG: M48 family metallopeptidase [Synergistaceae bacterium]|jgi:predicted metal-dependent hydrolase|nr:M48 family metallopeptidase [Synergistaceae bacterium]
MPRKAAGPVYVKTYSEGEIFLYGGERRALVRVGGRAAGERARVSGGRLIVYGEAHDLKRFITYWYAAETEKIARALVPAWSKKLRVRPLAITVKYMRTRWGSCSSAGRISLNLRLSMLSPDVAEYVIVHELCHMKQMNHSDLFWNEVRSALPEATTLRKKLRAEEREAVL